MKPGDVCTIEITGIGVLSNPVLAEDDEMNNDSDLEEVLNDIDGMYRCGF